MKILNLSVNLPNESVLEFGDMQITFVIDHTARCLTLPHNAMHEQFKDQVIHTHVKGSNLQPRTLMETP